MDFKVEEKENDSGEETRHGGGVLRWVWIAGVAVVFYVLSVGPMCKLSDEGVVPSTVMQVVYAPLIWVCHESQVANDFFRWYCKTVWKARC
jgi:hypothetical protein